MSSESREQLMKRLIDDNALVQEAIRVEPEIGQIIEEVKAMKNEPGYNRVVTRSRLKRRLKSLVGMFAGEPPEVPSKSVGYRHISEAVDKELALLDKLMSGEFPHPLKTREHWDAVINVLDQLLPPDDEDLRAEHKV